MTTEQSDPVRKVIIANLALKIANLIRDEREVFRNSVVQEALVGFPHPTETGDGPIAFHGARKLLWADGIVFKSEGGGRFTREVGDDGAKRMGRQIDSRKRRAMRGFELNVEQAAAGWKMTSDAKRKEALERQANASQMASHAAAIQLRRRSFE